MTSNGIFLLGGFAVRGPYLHLNWYTLPCTGLMRNKLHGGLCLASKSLTLPASSPEKVMIISNSEQKN